MNKRVLLIEDSEHKRSRALSFLSESFPHVSVVEAHSFTSGCKIVESSNFDVVIMDMSLPTYDKSSVESGGKFRTFGGREIAKKMARRGNSAKIVFLTQYDAFSDKANSHTLISLDAELRFECKDSYLGLIYYDSSKSSWKERLEKALVSLA